MLQLYLWHDFYGTIFKITHKLHSAPGSAPPQIKKSGCPPDRIGDEMFIDLTGNVLACREAQLVKTCNEFHTAQNKEPLS